VPELLLSHLPKFIEFYLCIQLLPSKLIVSWPVAHPVTGNGKFDSKHLTIAEI